MRRKIKYHRHAFFRNKDGCYRNSQTTPHKYKYEQKYGMILPCFQLHHKDGNKFDNRLSNLMILTFREHMEVHKLTQREMVYAKQVVLIF